MLWKVDWFSSRGRSSIVVCNLVQGGRHGTEVNGRHLLLAQKLQRHGDGAFQQTWRGRLLFAGKKRESSQGQVFRQISELMGWHPEG
jgi:hypothetical protein